MTCISTDNIIDTIEDGNTEKFDDKTENKKPEEDNNEINNSKENNINKNNENNNNGNGNNNEIYNNNSEYINNIENNKADNNGKNIENNEKDNNSQNSQNNSKNFKEEKTNIFKLPKKTAIGISAASSACGVGCSIGLGYTLLKKTPNRKPNINNKKKISSLHSLFCWNNFFWNMWNINSYTNREI